MKIAKKIVPFIIAAGILVGSTALAGTSPKLYRLSKYKGKVGDKIRVKGTNFGKHEGEVIFDGVENVDIQGWGKTKVFFIVPQIASGQSYKVRICRKNGECSKSQKFYVERTGPELWQIKNLNGGNNYQGVPGDRLRITGLNLNQNNISVMFGSTAAQILKKTKKSIDVAVPNVQRDKTYPVFITDGTNNSNSQDFFVKP